MTIVTNYSEWARDFDQQCSVGLKVTDKIVMEACTELVKRIEKRTPVGDPSLWSYPAPAGYKPGTLKASWSMESSQTKAGVIVTISNDQPYAERVEFGWSTQAPNGMIRISLLEFPSIVDKIAVKYK